MWNGRQTAGHLALAILSPSIACTGPQSALDPAGRAAQDIADLFWWMTIGGFVVWAAVIGVAGYAVVRRDVRHGERTARWVIVGGGVIVPTLVLTGVLVYGLAMLPPLLAPAPAGSTTIAVTGEQYWWRVRVRADDGTWIETANEIHLPVDAPTELHLDSVDVIHSFWIPALGGKVDMIPGRRNRLVLEPTRTGQFRGACAEYCGASHAWMAFAVVVESREAFDRWRVHEAAPAEQPTDAAARRGRVAFERHGCGGCHSIRGTAADGVVGPDLTHVGGRRSLAAGALANEHGELQRWIAEPASIKPGALMPRFAMIPGAELQAIAVYLGGLQ